MSERSYRQICGVARALDLLGDRWTLLVIRELLLGPKRFGALRAALPGIGPNLLSERLRSLAGAGVLERVELPPPASVSAYALTPRGEQLREVVERLALWGFEMVDGQAEYEQGFLGRGSWLASTLAAASAGADSWADAEPVSVNFDVSDDRFVVRTDATRAHVRHGVGESADASLECDLPTFADLTRGDERADNPTVHALLTRLASRT